MTGKKSEAVPGEQLERLIDAVEAVAGELRVLRDVLDEIRDDFGWAVQNVGPSSGLPPFVLTSMPADPLASDWPERLNRLKPADIERPTAEPANASSIPQQQRELW